MSGTGSIVPTQVMIEAAGTEILKLISDLDRPGGAGYGYACEAGFGTSLNVGDWRDVDTAIARVGPWIAERHLALKVAISVEVYQAD